MRPEGDSAYRRGPGGGSRGRRIAAGLGIALLLLLPRPAPAQADTTPPALAGFTFSPTAIDTSDAAATVVVTFHVTDGLSGVASVRATFTNRDISSEPQGCESLTPDSGTSLDGVYSCAVVFPRYSDPGTWQVLAVELTDAAANERLLLTAALAGMSFPTDLQVTTAPDLTPPVLAGFSFLPMAIDTSTGAATIQATFHLTDERSGVAWGKVNFLGPGGGGATHGCTALAETPGQEAALDVMISCTVDFPPSSPQGSWSVIGVDAADAAGNNASYSDSNLISLGFPASLLVTTQSDTSPPGLTGFSFTPAVIDTQEAPALVEVSFSVTDNLSGVGFVDAVFTSPGAPPQTLGCSSTFPDGGSPLSGVFRCPIPFPSAGEEGVWTVSQVEIRDASNQSLVRTTSQLAQAGFPVNLSSGFLPGPPRAVVEAPTAGESIRGDRVTVSARLLQGNPGEVSPSAGIRLEFRSLPFGAFAPVPAAEAVRPNPDPSLPYYLHWDVTGLPDGGYELRAIAHDAGGNPDPAPATVAIQISNGPAADIEEGLNPEGRLQSRSGIDNDLGGAARAGDISLRGGLIRFGVPPGSLNEPVDTVRMIFPDEAGELPKLEQPEQSTGVFVDIALESGQAVLAPGSAAVIDLQYPDADRDGVIDGTAVPEKDLELRRLDETLGKYVRLPPWSVLTEHNQLHAMVTATGRFALTRSLEPRLRFRTDGVTLEWDPITEALRFNVYRGALSLLRDLNGNGLPDGGYGDCQNFRDSSLTDTQFVDTDPPAGPGQGFFYLASFTGPGGERGLGSTSRGFPRTVTPACP